MFSQSSIRQRLRVVIRGAVQGVGFRPFVYRGATELGLCGWVSNSPQGVLIEVEGPKQRLEDFLTKLEREKPSRAFIQSCEPLFLDQVGFEGFEIRESDHSGSTSALILPDIATCPDCLREVLDPTNRRYLYPFTNCTNCGPRFSIIESLPYDRVNTTMRMFAMCPECFREYGDPTDRRFHAQPNACPTCGPHVELWDAEGTKVADRNEAMDRVAELFRRGEILAIKGIGGYQLMVDARDEQAVRRLRRKKHREEKPLAVMFPSLASVRAECIVSAKEERLLLSPEAPIVLLRQKSASRDEQVGTRIASSVAPRNPYLGVMVPYSPLHHILLHNLGFPIVATSGNLSEEPMCTDEHEAVRRLRGIADAFLVHNRPIIRHVDDSVVREMAGREMVVRRARGYAPLPVMTSQDDNQTILAVGAHLKNTVALTSGRNAFISQHIGNLETLEAYAAFRKVNHDFMKLFDTKPDQIVCDRHPDYLSSKFAASLGLRVTAVQHHYAHIAACMAENEIDGEVLGVSWDGTGYGLDGTIWGGEFLLTTPDSFKRVATLRSFRLPGGERSIQQPRRTAIGLLFELFGDEVFELPDILPTRGLGKEEKRLFQQMLGKRVHAPSTSSAGRLFDAVGSIIGLRHEVSFEGQAAMELEFALPQETTQELYEMRMMEWGKLLVVDWEPMLIEMFDDLKQGIGVAVLSNKFHNTLVEAIVAVASKVALARVVLSGGCFQNKYLAERTIRRLEEEGFRPYWHQRVPPNDGGISLGQVFAARRQVKAKAADAAELMEDEYLVPADHSSKEESGQ